jgi:hypothetical protein
MEALPPKPLRQILHIWIGRHRQKGQWLTARRIGWISSGQAMHAEELLSTEIIRFESLIRDWPGWRHTASVLDVVEIVLPESRQRRAVDFGVPANEIMDAGREPPTIRVPPFFASLVAIVAKHRHWIPILDLFGQKGPSLDEQNPGAAIAQSPCERSAAHAGTKNGDIRVVVTNHDSGGF